MAASILEVGATLATWPQLGGDVLLGGGASVVAAIRRFGLGGEALPSGRVRIDIGEHLDQLSDPRIPPQDSITSGTGGRVVPDRSTGTVRLTLRYASRRLCRYTRAVRG